MALISDGKFVENDWRHLADEEDLPKAGKIIVSQTRLDEALAALPADRPLGVIVANTTDPAALAPHFSRLALIAVAFPAFADGRGFSLARLLRRAGFTGELRASGRLVADQSVHARPMRLRHDRNPRRSRGAAGRSAMARGARRL